MTLLCNAMGNPTPVVTVNPAIAPISDNKIVFTTVAMSDAGTYTCTASSPGFADVSRQFQLMVGGKSSAFYNQHYYLHAYTLY